MRITGPFYMKIDNRGKKFDADSLKNKAVEYNKQSEAQDEATSTKLLMERRIKGFYKGSE